MSSAKKSVMYYLNGFKDTKRIFTFADRQQMSPGHHQQKRFQNKHSSECRIPGNWQPSKLSPFFEWPLPDDSNRTRIQRKLNQNCLLFNKFTRS